mmetsp:Transcript_72834/g.131200  ORF Transcript_72834/g.131200 Transcript_72834/m.131200 type:complete len:446 (+) Transcript_72834:860-2197(+)
MHLLLLVPSNVQFQCRVQSELVRMPGFLGQGGLGTFACHFANDVLDLLAGSDWLASGHETEGNLNVWLVFGIGVILWILGESLCDDILGGRDLQLIHFNSLVSEELVHPVHGLLLVDIVAVQNAQQDRLAHLLRQGAPVAAHNVQTLELMLELLRLPINDLHASVLLLFQEHQADKDCVDLNFEALVPLVHGALDLLSCLHRLIVVGGLGVHKHRVCVTVDHIELQLLLNDRDRRLQRLSALGGDERRQGLGIKAAVGETQAAIHRVRSQLDSLLADLQHLQLLRVSLRLHRHLHGLSALNQTSEHLRQCAFLRGPVRKLRLGQELGLIGNLRNVILVRPLDGGEADVVLLDDRRIQTVEVKHDHEVVIETSLGLQNETAAVLGFAASRPRGALVWLISIVKASAVSLLALLRKVVLFVWQHKLLLVELVQKKHLIPLRALVLER